MSVAIVTPWLDHLELGPEYDRALELGGLDVDAGDELVIVDDGSDPPLEFAELRNATTLGFCAASNRGLAEATADVVLFLNNDVEATRVGWLEELVDEVEPGVLVGHRLRTDQHARVDNHVYPYLDGWCLAGLRTELLELGGFDEQLDEPAYYSDNLLCLEARAAGMRLREVPVGLIHLGGATTGAPGNPAASAATLTNRRRYQERARALALERSTA